MLRPVIVVPARRRRELTRAEMRLLGMIERNDGQQLSTRRIADIVGGTETQAAGQLRLLRKMGYVEGFSLTDAGRWMLWPHQRLPQ